MFLFAKPALLGLDIGSTMIKAVSLRKRDGRLIAERAAIAAMPAGALSDGVFLDPPAVSATIRKLCRDQGLHGQRVAVALAGQDVFVTRLKVERAAGESLDARLREETARLAPFSLENASVAFQVLDTFSNSTWVEALVAAASRGRIDRLQEVLAGAGKTPVVVDSAACALANAFQVNYDPSPTQITALLHLGAAAMTVVIVRGATPLVARDLSLAPAQFTEEEWSLTDRIAVQLERVFELMDELADEHPLEPRPHQIERLLLSGGGARLRGLDEVLKNRIELPFEEMNPFRKIEFDSSDTLSRLVWEHVHCMPVAVGLALRGV